MRGVLGFNLDERRRLPTWAEALRWFIDQADGLSILVMVSGVVGSNNRRRLDPEEFRGFALAEPLAPLVFVNGADTKAAQMFTLAHELAHVWLGETAVSDAQASEAPQHDVERWCNQVAAELLVPLAALRETYDRNAALDAEVDRLARRFKVSTPAPDTRPASARCRRPGATRRRVATASGAPRTTTARSASCRATSWTSCSPPSPGRGRSSPSITARR
jgi:hypothetical protein